MAEGGADFCLTSVGYFLRALSDRAVSDRAVSGAPLPARFAGIMLQHTHMAAIVAADSPLRAPSDLPGRRVGGGPFVVDYQGCLRALGLGPGEEVPMDYLDAPAALARGEIDAVADFVDTLPLTRRRAGVPVRLIPFAVEIYGSGLVAADRLPPSVVARMRAAMAAALERQRQDPERALPELRRRYPNADPEGALEGWSVIEPHIFTGVEPGSMEPARWEATIAHLCAVHGFSAPGPDQVYRPELAGVPTGT